MVPTSGETPEDRPGKGTPAESPTSASETTTPSSPPMSEAQRALRAKLAEMGFKEDQDDGLPSIGIVGGVHPEKP